MVLLAATLASGLEAMEPTDSEATAIDNFATAWGDYFAQASVAGVVTTPGSLDSALVALKAGLIGISTGTAAALIQSAITTFWSVVAAAASTIWVVTPPVLSAVVPPGLGGIQAALEGAFSSNQSGKLELAAAASTVATALNLTQVGGTVAQGPPPTGNTIL